MNHFENSERSEYEKKQHAAVDLVWRVNEILEANPRTLNMDIRDVIQSNSSDIEPRQDELIRMSANNHLKCLAAFYKRLYPDATSVKVQDGTHSALPLYDTMTNTNIMLLATTLQLQDDRSLGAVTVTVRDEYVLSGSTIYLNDDGRIEAYNEIKPRDDKLVIEALELVGVGRRDMVVPVLSGVLNEAELIEYLDALKPIISENYDDAEVQRFLADLENRYREKVQSRKEADEMGLSTMSSGEIEDLLTILEPASDWS